MSDQYEQYYPYRVGEVDPAYSNGLRYSAHVLHQTIEPRGEWCGHDIPNTRGHWICTLPHGHSGPHVAHRGDGKVLGIDPPFPEYLQVSEGL